MKTRTVSLGIKTIYTDEVVSRIVDYFLDPDPKLLRIRGLDKTNQTQVNSIKKFTDKLVINSDRSFMTLTVKDKIKLTVTKSDSDHETINRLIKRFDHVDGNKSELLHLVRSSLDELVDDNYYQVDLDEIIVFGDFLNGIMKDHLDKEFELEVVEHCKLGPEQFNRKWRHMDDLDRSEYRRWFYSRSTAIVNIFDFKNFYKRVFDDYPNDLEPPSKVFPLGMIEELLCKMDDLCFVEIMAYKEDKLPLIFPNRRLNAYGPLMINQFYSRLADTLSNSRWLLTNTDQLVSDDYQTNVNDLKAQQDRLFKEFLFDLFSAQDLSVSDISFMRNSGQGTSVRMFQRGMEKDYYEKVNWSKGISKMEHKILMFEI